MKNNTLILIVILSNLSLMFAQDKPENTYYVSGELNLGNYYGVDINYNYVFQNKYSLQLGFSGNVRKPITQPENYSSGLNGFFSGGIETPHDHFLNYKFDLGRIYNLNKNGTVRVNFLVGIGYTIIKEPENWKYAPSDSFINLVENYTYSYRKNSALSIIINPKLEFPVVRHFGLTLSPMAQITKERTYFGIGFGTMIGKLK